MPALGMAQDTGLIVAWLKSPGDAVSTGDALMEVETDKATMEVEAAADGFLTDVRAKAGDNVPVGDVVALISETAAGSENAAAPAPKASADIEGHQIIMPALGMAQDTGLIVAWHKEPGDAVAADDVLFEVETDKSTMEVPAGKEGFLAAIHAAGGQEVPVGEVIAVISVTRPDAPVGPDTSVITKKDAVKAATRNTAKQTARDAVAPVVAVPSASSPPTGAAPKTSQGKLALTDRILASPKARRLAAEEDLDLSRLVEAGHAQPYHVADLDILRNLPSFDPAKAVRVPHAPGQITARVPLAAVAGFVTWAQGEGVTIAPPRLFAAFAAAALRSVRQQDRIVIAISGADGTSHGLADPDIGPLSDVPEASDAAPDLIIHDLTASAITGIRSGAVATATLVFARDADCYALTLEFDAEEMETRAAVALMSDVAERLSDPLRHLL